MRLFFIAVCITLILPFRLQSQQFTSQSFVFDSKTTNTSATKSKHDLLFLVTNGNPKFLSTIQINYFIDSRFYLQKTSYSTSEILLEISNIVVTGDTLYRSFTISPSLCPDCFEGKFTLNNLDESIQNKIVKVSEIGLNRSVRIGFCDFEENPSTKLNGKLTNFDFSAKASEQLENHVNYINDYWATKVLMDSLQSEINENNISNSNDIPQLFVFWDKTRKISIIASESIDNEVLGLKFVDPFDLIGKKNQFDRLNTRFRTLLENELKQVIRKDFVNGIAEKYLQSLQKYRQASKRVDFYDANIFYTASQLKLDKYFVEMLTKLGRPDEHNSVAQQIYDGLKKTAFEEFEKDDLADAITIFTDLKAFEKAFPDLIKDVQVEDRFVKAKEGLLNSFLQIASRAMLANNTDMAARYHHKAEDFRKKYYAEDQLDDIKDMTGNLVSAYYKKGIELKNSNLTEDAIRMFEQALTTSKTFGNGSFTVEILKELKLLHIQVYLELVKNATEFFEDGNEAMAASENEKALFYREDHLEFLETSVEAILLQRKMKQPVVNSSIENGIISAQQGQAKQALEAYNNARILADEFKLIVDAPIDSLANAAAKQVIIQTIRSANSKVWSNEMDAALKIYTEAKELQQKYGLESDSAIRDEFRRLDNKMIQQACFNCKRDYDNLVLKLEKAIRMNRFDQFANTLQAAIELGEQNSGCLIDLTKVRNFQNKYQKLLDYNKRYNEVMQVMYNQGFAEAISLYEKLDGDSHLFSLNDYAISHLTVLQFIENQDNSGLTRIALTYYLSKNDAANALKSFELFQQQSSEDNEAIQLGQDLAEMLAKQDVELSSEIPPETLSYNYFGQEKRNKSLRLTYLRTYRNLIK
ncbi:MAG: hypothetical protein HOO86_14495 [Bacteroidales bacterium]|nr:hypothetical protein [Bacteroidales bacterium]